MHKAGFLEFLQTPYNKLFSALLLLNDYSRQCDQRGGVRIKHITNNTLPFFVNLSL